MERTEKVFSKIIAFVAAVVLVMSFTAPIGALAEQAELLDQEPTTNTASVASKTDTPTAPESTTITTTSILTTTEETEEIDNGSGETTDDQGETEESPALKETEEVGSAIIPTAGDEADQPIEAAVAEFNGKEYASLQEAVKAVESNGGGTITLLRDCIVDVWPQKWRVDNLTLNGNGHTLSFRNITSGGNGDYLLHGAKNLTVTNFNIILPQNGSGFYVHSGKFDHVSFSGGVYGICAGSEGLSVNNCAFSNHSGMAIYDNTESGSKDLVVDNSRFENTRVGILRENEQVTNCTITGSTDHYQLTIVGDNTTVTNNSFSTSAGGTLELYNVTNKNHSIIKNDFEHISYSLVDGCIADLSENYWGGILPELDHGGDIAVVTPETNIVTAGDGNVAIHTYYVTNPVGNSDAILDHDWGIVESTDPTCYDDGYEHLSCQQCELKKNVVIPATDHDWGEWQVVSEPAIGVQGLAQRVCAHDNAHIEQQVIPALADEATPPSEDDDPQQPVNDDENAIVTPLATTTDDANDTPDGPTPPAAPTEQLVDDETPLAAPTETIIDDETPLAAFDTPQCWVHILMIIGIIVTLIYGACVIARRTRFTHKLDKLERNTVSQRKAHTTERDTLWVTA